MDPRTERVFAAGRRRKRGRKRQTLTDVGGEFDVSQAAPSVPPSGGS
jgi:hypothetical protein